MINVSGRSDVLQEEQNVLLRLGRDTILGVSPIREYNNPQPIDYELCSARIFCPSQLR